MTPTDDRIRAALLDACKLLDGWVAYKCAPKFRAEHTAHIEKLRAVAALAAQEPAANVDAQAESVRSAPPAAPEAMPLEPVAPALLPSDSPEVVARLKACLDDPMWADHAEISKATLRRTITLIASLNREATTWWQAAANAAPISAQPEARKVLAEQPEERK